MIELEIKEDLDRSLSEELRRALRWTDTVRVLANIEQTILRRTIKGEFLPGSSPGADEYSTTPFARPAGGLSDEVHQSAENDAEVSSYFTKDEDLWMTFEGGYKQLRALKGLPTGHVDLYETGGMLAGLRSRAETDDDGNLNMEAGYIKGLSPARAIELANYHNRLGAGKAETIRKFVGLTDPEADDILDDLENDITRRL